ncbi:pyruvate formate-lyase-activating protein [Dactylococcopsis salina]|uniref:Pyruvate formate-lyase-activating enzyme n=1 Tax=Dactylococcopsis salina (strain PCC 8305) TaxID=13035 RepID=K9YVP8_DACS8|nr:pyruvate formate-lyase-activating protein [Dactylococcopsis salina]AFZ50415.1 pyruvate formate-lyase 1-activating enzyme [Dactylococcopsis salina PCC 8305]
MLTNTPTETKGRIHSIESCGTVDGPGIRFVIFTQGCPLRCLYCHNPDCRHIEDGKEATIEELITEIQKYRSYMRFSGGGVTVTGGEPLMQPEFVTEIFKQCQALGIHTALDTSGYVPIAAAKPVLDYTDLVLLDIKSYKPDIYRTVTSVSVEPTLNFARYLSEIKQPTWVRFVLVPNLTDSVENIKELAAFVASLQNVEKLEVLPFHQMGTYKWEKLGYDYQLKETKPPSPDLIASTINIFQSYGIKVSY